MAGPRALEPEQWELWDGWMQAHRLLTRELERALQRDHGISKAEFSVLVTLHLAPEEQVRVGALAESLGWDKSRVVHQVTRMENRGLLTRTDNRSNGRRAAIGLTADGRRVARDAVLDHGDNIRRLFFEALTPGQAATLREWSQQTVARMASGTGATGEGQPAG